MLCLKDVRFAILNGRITPEYDGYTSISIKGTATVDYVCTKYESIECSIECKTVSMNNMLHEICAECPDFTPEQTSNHSLIIATFKDGEDYEVGHLLDSSSEDDSTDAAGHPKPTRFKMTGIKEDFLKSPKGGENWWR